MFISILHNKCGVRLHVSAYACVRVPFVGQQAVGLLKRVDFQSVCCVQRSVSCIDIDHYLSIKKWWRWCQHIMIGRYRPFLSGDLV